MSERELLRSMIDDCGHQIQAVFGDMPEAGQDDPVTEQGMTARRTVVHLAECCLAIDAHLKGEKFGWGTYGGVGGTYADEFGDYLTKREEAVTKLLTSEDAKALHAAHEFLIAHEYYHVGQGVLLRMRHQPDWNPYSIYRHA
jgi:uncharacterized damage-inducible protein DinB